MRDGTTLRANIYRPAEKGSYPVLLARLPYSKDLPIFHAYFDPIQAAKHGYIVVIQDSRGRFQSDGEWDPFVDEFNDGYDTVEWAAKLPDADGQVGMWGISYFGMTQWQAAVMQRPSLKAIVPGQTWGNYLTGVFWRGGARELGALRHWVHSFLSWDTVLKKYRESEKLPQILAENVALVDNLTESFKTAPLKDSPDPGEVLPYMYDWLKHSFRDSYWNDLNIDQRYDKVDVPNLHVGGWYDKFLNGTLEQYQAMKEQALQLNIPLPRLIVGPWQHGTFDSFVGEEEFGFLSSGALLNFGGNITEQHLKFYDAILKGENAALQNVPPVQIFVMGDNQWRGYEEWPVPDAKEERLYFHSEGHANTRFGNGHLNWEKPNTEEQHDTYLYDPEQPVPTKGGPLLLPAKVKGGAVDQSQLEERSDILCYTSEVLEQDYTVIGNVSATLYAASSARDTDFVVRLVDVHPDGKAVNITDGIIRASARESYPEPGLFQPTNPSLIEPERIYKYSVDMWATAMTFKAGHRIRVEVSSSNFPRWDRNLNTGQDSLTSSDSQTAIQSIFHNPTYPSSITLPVVQKQ
ncbi:CocE/NonD family hydrolase [Alkalihalobacterium alkalinitrilicum]|uniref:CocE/NonD family hydrolase n=1 Tax=Alkalihalobacterium alkalinitrilicum TaxID=427920 RepID=UPI000994FF28|nr:CocE/NonD family hydrolase [Alkalihalobacterium alkalinitrilicum]